MRKKWTKIWAGIATGTAESPEPAPYGSTSVPSPTYPHLYLRSISALLQTILAGVMEQVQDVPSSSSNAVIDLARLHCVKSVGEGSSLYQLIDVPRKDAPRRHKELKEQGWTITHTEVV